MLCEFGKLENNSTGRTPQNRSSPENATLQSEGSSIYRRATLCVILHGSRDHLVTAQADELIEDTSDLVSSRLLKVLCLHIDVCARHLA